MEFYEGNLYFPGFFLNWLLFECKWWISLISAWLLRLKLNLVFIRLLLQGFEDNGKRFVQDPVVSEHDEERVLSQGWRLHLRTFLRGAEVVRIIHSGVWCRSGIPSCIHLEVFREWKNRVFSLMKGHNVFTYLAAFWCWIACYECYDMIFKFFFRFRVSLPNTRLPCANRCLRRVCAWRDQSVTSPTRSQRNWLAEKRTQSSRPCSAKASRQPEAVQSKCRKLTL